MIAEIKFACSHCGQRIAVGSDAAGMEIECPTCQNTVTIPPEGAVPEPRRSDAALRERVAALQSECEKLRANATHAQAELKSFHNERLTLRSEAAAWKQRAGAAEQLAGEMEIVRQRLEATETQLAAVERDLAENHAGLGRATAERATALQEIEKLRSELAASVRARSAGESAEARLAEREARLSAAQTALAHAQSEATGLTGRIAAMEAETASLRDLMNRDETSRELLSIRTKLAAAEEELQTRRQSAAQLDADLKKAESDRARLDQERIDLHRRVAEAQKEAENLSKDQVHADNQKLREMLDRQNEELKLRFKELTRFRRAKLTLKVVWGLAALAAISLGFAFVKVLPTLEWTK